MLLHLVLPLERQSRRADDHDALRRFTADEACDEQAGLDGFAEPHVIREDVAEPFRRENLVQQEGLMRQRLHRRLREPARQIVFADDQPGGELAPERRDLAPASDRRIGKRVRHDLHLRRRDIFQVVEVVKCHLQALVPESVLLHVAHQTKAVFRVRAMDDTVVGLKRGAHA